MEVKYVFTAVSFPTHIHLMFWWSKSIICDSTHFYKSRGEFRAPFNPFIGVYGLRTHSWRVYGREHI